MAATEDVKQAVEAFASAPLDQAARRLWETLGYRSEKALDLPADPEMFFRLLEVTQPISRERACFSQWKAVHFLFQVTNDEIPALAYGQTVL